MIRKLVLNTLVERVAKARLIDQIIGSREDPYLLRWYVIPRNPIFNIYLHRFCRSDDDRALHDHPWWNFSWLLEGDYREEVPADRADPAGERRIILRSEGDMAFRFAKDSHRVLLYSYYSGQEIPVWTLFITGPRFRKWGFWCPHSWRFWKDFTNNEDGVSEIGRGCD